MAREMIVVPYNEVWPDLYIREKELLESVFGELILDIQHFGSTSVKGMSAKPVIDIMIVVEDINQIDKYNEIMIEKGYTPRGENGIEGRRYFVKLAPDGSRNHTHHIHIYQKGNQHITDELMFRDYLGVDPESFREYEKVKIEASIKYRHSPGEYVDAKQDSVMRIMEKARSYFAKNKGGNKVPEKFLCLIATFDKETSKRMKEIEYVINEAGIIGKQTPDIPHHITMAYFDTSREDEIKNLLEDVCSKTKSFDLTFNHIGLFGLKVMFLAPDVNYELLELHKSFEKDSITDSKGWTAHATILIDEEENILKALPLVAKNFSQINARVESVSLYEFFPTRFIAEYSLQ